MRKNLEKTVTNISIETEVELWEYPPSELTGFINRAYDGEKKDVAYSVVNWMVEWFPDIGRRFGIKKETHRG